MRVLVTGMSGVGKSTLLAELARRGHRTVDTDHGGYAEHADGEQLWREDRVGDLIAGHGDGLLVLAGTVRNQVAFYRALDHVVLLSAPDEVLVARLRTRTTNPYGRDPAEVAETLEYVRTVEPLLRGGACLEVDTRSPVAVVADTVLEHVQRHPACTALRPEERPMTPSPPRRDPTGPGQESVWDYPRPPRVEPVEGWVEVRLGGRRVAYTNRALRVLETSHPPTYYLPIADFTPRALRPAEGRSVCEWKGEAAYLDVLGGGEVAVGAAWMYPEPRPGFETLASHVAVYPALVEQCLVNGEVVRPQPGGFYGGWITSAVVGPFKGEPGTQGW